VPTGWESPTSEPPHERPVDWESQINNSLLEVVDVDLDVLLPLGWDIVLGEDRLHRALIDAQTAVDTGVWIDVQLLGVSVVALLLGRVNAVHWADLDAGRVLGSDARFSDDMCHDGKNSVTRELSGDEREIRLRSNQGQHGSRAA